MRCNLVWLSLLVCCPGARAEFRRIEQALTGMECASCARSVTATIQKMRGVESVELQQNVARIQLKPDNRVRLEVIRDVIKGVGITPAEAKVQVRGKAQPREGRWDFEVEGLAQILRLSMDDPSIAAINRAAGRMLLLEGVIPAPGDPRSPLVLQVHSIRSDPQP